MCYIPLMFCAQAIQEHMKKETNQSPWNSRQQDQTGINIGVVHLLAVHAIPVSVCVAKILRPGLHATGSALVSDQLP